MEGDRVRRDKARKRKFETDAKRLKKHDAFENDRASKQRLRHNSKTSDVPSPAKRKEIKWNDSNTHGLDFATMIKGYDSMTSAERLKARTRFVSMRLSSKEILFSYLEKQYGSVATLDANRRKFEGLVDAEDDLESLKKEEIVSIRTHDVKLYFNNFQRGFRTPSSEQRNFI